MDFIFDVLITINYLLEMSYSTIDKNGVTNGSCV